MDNSIRVSAKFSNVEKFNSQFHKVKVYVAYDGLNRNGSDISKEVLDNMIPSIFGIPVVGEWKEEKEDFGSHGGKLEISDEGMKFIETTKPYGYVDSSAVVTYEAVREKDGTYRDYLTTDAFLWTGRYPEALKVLEGMNNQSMEISILDGEYREEDDVYEIKKAEFSALCILGEDVEPCFESASVKQFSYEKEDFKNEFFEMVKELKAAMEEESEGGDEEVDNTENMEVEVKEEIVNEPTEIECEANEEEIKEEVVVEEEEEEIKEEKELNELSEENEKEEEDSEENYSFQIKILTDKLMEYEAEIEKLNSLVETQNSELGDLREFKSKIELEEKKVEIEELFSKFTKYLDEEMLALKEKAVDMELQEVEGELYKLVGRKVLENKFSKKESSKATVVELGLDLGDEKIEKNSKPYEHLIEQYAKPKK